MGIRLLKRSIQFGSDDEPLAPQDLTLTDELESTVSQSGTPVAILFGTRRIEPITAAWGTLGVEPFWYYDGTGSIGAAFDTPHPPNVTIPDEDLVRMTLLTMRLAVIVGQADNLTAWVVGGYPVNAQPASLPPRGTVSLSDYQTVERINTVATRYLVPVADADLFGGGLQGGLGFPDERFVYGPFTRFSEFWASTIRSPTNSSLDYAISYRGLTTLYFRGFNFGTYPPQKWSVAATRINKQTRQVPARIDSTEPYVDQWQPNYRDAPQVPLASISSIPTRPGKKYYLFVLSNSLFRTQREYVRQLLLSLPYDDDTDYSIVFLNNALLTASVHSRTGASRSVIETTLTNWLTSDTDSTIASGGYIMPNRTIARSIVNTYVEYMDLNTKLTADPIAGTIVFMMNDIFSMTPASQINSNTHRQNLRNFFLTLSYISFPPSSPPVDDNNRITDANYPFATNDRSALEILRNNQPEIRVGLYQYFYPTSNPLTYAVTTDAIRLRDYNRYSFSRPAIAGWGGGFPRALPPIVYGAIQALDSTGRTFDMYDVTEQDFKAGFLAGAPFGFSMNPVHALRETLIDSNWGEGIDESKIDDEAFYQAAVVCKSEGLDYCYVHRKLGNNNALLKGITDYIDGICYYEPQTDRVTLKLIREDYNIGDLQMFDESNISWIRGFKRQHGNELVNSMTVRYHDAALGAQSSVTVHDLSGDNQAGIVAATLSYDGCATRSAAEHVARRELSALSRSFVSFSALINPSQHIGLGDPIVINFDDLHLRQIVMRVVRINYSDGLTGGIEVQLIQDVFSPPVLGSSVGAQPLPDFKPIIPDAHVELQFLEQSRHDRTQRAGTITAGDRFFKIGRKSLMGGTISLNSIDIVPSIGELQTFIDVLRINPRQSRLLLVVDFPDTPTGNIIRIGDELMLFTNQRQLRTGRWLLEVTRRAWADSVATSHLVGADVWIMDKVWQGTTAWDGAAFAVTVDVPPFQQRSVITPNITFIDRPLLPPPPEYVTVTGLYSPITYADNDIAITYRPRTYSGDTRSQSTLISLTHEGNSVYETVLTVPAPVGGTHAVMQHTIPTASIAPLTAATLNLAVSSRIGSDDSWQKWEFIVDWANRDRSADREGGWSYGWGNDWGDDEAQGWGFNWNNEWNT